MTGRARSLAAIILVACVVLSIDTWALERPGGGQGYSGSSGSSSSNDSDGDGGGAALILLFELLRVGFTLTSRYPAVMWPVWGVAAALAVLWVRSLPDPRVRDWTVASMKAAESVPAPVATRVELERLRDADPEFSMVLFEDFVYTLYARAHEARGRGRVGELGAYLAAEAERGLSEMSARGLAAVEGIVIGALGYERVRMVTASDGATRVSVELEIEANYTERVAGAPPLAYWVCERWILSRPRSARSLPPERMRSVGCPGCGAPVASRDAGVCDHCGRKIDTADFDWLVDRVWLVRRKQTPPALTGDTPETGTDRPTVVDGTAESRRRAIETRDAACTWPAFEARVRHIFAELQPAWSTLDLGRARPYLSERLVETWAFWFEAYRRAGLRNTNADARVSGIELARVVSDRHFDAITVRVRATGLDFTTDENGELRAGSRETPRAYTEYWTLIRGGTTTGAPRADSLCPRCGAPLAVTMGGACEHCGAHVSSGEFDWVLSRVEQDDAYRG